MIRSDAARSHSEKLLKYIEELRTTKPYKATQLDLVQIAKNCENILDGVYHVLQNCDASVDTMNSEYLRMKQICSMLSTTMSNTIHKPDPASCSIKSEISKFEFTLQSLSSGATAFKESHTCAVILLEWYRCRFLNSQHTKFRYNIDKIRDWVIDVVIAYSKSVFDQKSESFLSSFRSWCACLSNPSSDQSKYPLPYEVYAVSKSRDESCLTSTCLVIWEDLFDTGLHNLVDPDRHIHFDRNDMKSICSEKCSRLVYWHEDYHNMSIEAIKINNLHSYSDSEVL